MTLPNSLHGIGFIHVYDDTPPAKFNPRRIQQLRNLIADVRKAPRINRSYHTGQIVQMINDSQPRLYEPYKNGELIAALLIEGFLLVSDCIHSPICYLNIHSASLASIQLRAEDQMLIKIREYA